MLDEGDVSAVKVLDDDVDLVLLEFERSCEQSFSKNLFDVVKVFAPLGLIAFGGPAAHIAVLEDAVVANRHWLDHERFVEIMAVGQGLPGPTSTQMVVAIGALRAGPAGGVVAFLFWSLPSFVVLVVYALVSDKYIDSNQLPKPLRGLPAAAVSLVFVAAYRIASKIVPHPNKSVFRIKASLALTSTVVTLLVTAEVAPRPASAVFPALLILGGLTTLAHSRLFSAEVHYFTPLKPGEKSILAKLGSSRARAVGGGLILIWITILLTTVVLRANDGLDSLNAQLFEAFFRIGSIIYGGGQVVLPMLLTEVVEPNWVTEAQFFQGFALVQALPGPLFNFSAYLGAAANGFVGAMIAWIGLFGPGVMLIIAFLPFWSQVRTYSTFKAFLAGVNASAVGLLLAATAQLYAKAVLSWSSVAVFFFTLGVVLEPFKVPVPLGILLGGLFGWVLVALNIGDESVS